MAGGSTTLRDSLLPAVDLIRGIPGQMGLRPHVVSILVRTWSGPRVGVGASSDTETGLKTDLGLTQTKARNITQAEVIASGGLYSTQDIMVGPITPPFTGSTADNDAISIFDPPPNGAPVEVFFRIRGPGYPAGGGWFVKKAQMTDKPFRYMLILQKAGFVVAP